MTPPDAAVGTYDIALLTLDSLRFDVAVDAMRQGLTPNLGRVLPGGWEERHSPASFTYAAHRAFFAGFLPSPARPGPYERPFALPFPGSESVGPRTVRLRGSDIVDGLRQKGYRTICVGGVGFFDPATPLGADLTRSFEEVRWERSFRVGEPRSFAHQVAAARDALDTDDDRPRFLFLNASATHHPTHHYVEGATEESPATQAAALAHVDRHLGALLDALTSVRPCWLIVCSDHGTAYGEDGFVGHRVAHPVVWTVPYAEFVMG